MLSREVVAAALALAGIRSGAHVLDLTPDAGLGRAASAAAGSSGRVDPAGVELAAHLPAVRYGYAVGIWTNPPEDGVVGEVEQARSALAPYARVMIGSTDSLGALVAQLRSAGWTVLHGTTVGAAVLPDPARADHPSEVASRSPMVAPAELALAVARTSD